LSPGEVQLFEWRIRDRSQTTPFSPPAAADRALKLPIPGEGFEWSAAGPVDTRNRIYCNEAWAKQKRRLRRRRDKDAVRNTKWEIRRTTPGEQIKNRSPNADVLTATYLWLDYGEEW